jgi:hypothetical protein
MLRTPQGSSCAALPTLALEWLCFNVTAVESERLLKAVIS